MTKATIKLPDGTSVTIDGTPDEIKKLLEFYGAKPSSVPSIEQNAPPTGKKKNDLHEEKPDLIEIVNLVKNCDEAEAIEAQILDRTSQVDRTLLPLYIVHEYLGNTFALTSGEISQITTDLGIPILQPNASRTLSKTASRYVIGDKVKKKSQPVRYKMSRRGVQYLKSVLKGSKSEK